ncbi:aquaporin Z [Bacillus sp. 71mf]|nr:aquaporin Z [Bacillus sp. 71mf]SFT23003.1 aquaporin Z [Bacillus sp. 103mf]
MNYPNSGLSGTVTLITILQSTSLSLDNLRQNSFGNLDLCGAFLVEFILTFVFILVIVAVTGKKEIFL